MERSQPERRLPPLNALRFFEAAGRLQSIRQAAAELYVTPGAVSRQIQSLESWLGVSLFEHGARSVSLTAAGARYLQEVTEHLGALAAATADVTGRDADGSTLLIRSYTFFATSWLVPRLTEFRRREPWVDLQLVTSSWPADFGHRDANAEIRPGPRQWPGYDADLLISDEIVLVCGPDYCARHQIAGPRDLLRLGSAELLRSLASPRLWQGWLEMAGIPGLVPDCGPTYSDSTLTCPAAAFAHRGRPGGGPADGAVHAEERLPDLLLPRVSARRAEIPGLPHVSRMAAVADQVGAGVQRSGSRHAPRVR
jgi:LysR family glycine cleavage system transcriptional activator